MIRVGDTAAQLASIPNTLVTRDAPLSAYTRFGIGGPADIYVETANPESFVDALRVARESGLPTVVMGGGTNLIVSDDGFRGVVLKLASEQIRADGTSVCVEGGAVLQHLVDFAVDSGLKGLETMTGIPGSVGAAI